MENLSDLSTVQYSKLTSVNYSDSINSTVTVTEVFNNLRDLIPDDDYTPFYISRFNALGCKRFIELANKARGGKQPQRLFFWMLKNNQLVK